MLNLCGEVLGTSFHFLPLTQDKETIFLKSTRYGGLEIMSFYKPLMRKSKYSTGRLHKKHAGNFRWKVESGMGQGVLHTFNRVFHSRGFKSNWFYVNVPGITLCIEKRKRIFLQKLEENLFFRILLSIAVPESRTLSDRQCIFI